MLSLLRQRNFALLWAGQLFSLTGDWRYDTVALVMMIGKGAAGTLGDWHGVLPMLSVGSGLFIAAGFVALFTIPQS